MINFKKWVETPLSLILVLALAVTLRLVNGFYGTPSSQFTIVDELGFYQWSWDLYYYSAAWFGTYLPGPWQSLLGNLFMTVFQGTSGLVILGIAMGSIQVFLSYHLGKRLGGYETAFWLGLITAVLPYSIRFTSSFWNPNFVIPLSTLSFIALGQMAVQPKSWWIVVYVLSYALMPFFHAYPAFVVPMAVLAPFLLRIKPSYGFLSLGLFLSALCYLPFFLMDWKNDFYILGGIFQHTSGAIQKRILNPEALKFFSNLLAITSSDVSRFTGLNWETYRYFLGRYYPHYAVGLVLIVPSFVLSLLALGSFFRVSVFIPGKRWWWVFLGFIALPEILFLLTLQPHQERYLVNVWPLLYFILALYLTRIFGLTSERFSGVARVLVVLFLATSVYQGLVLSHYERHPNVEGRMRIPPSLAWYERTEKLLCAELGKEWKAGPLHHSALGKPATHTFFPKQSTQATQLKPTVLSFYDGNFDRSLDRGVERRRLELFQRWLEYHGRFRVAAQNEADYQLFFVPKGGVAPSEMVAASSRCIGSVPNADIWLMKLK